MMPVSRFKSEFRRGLGSAILELRECPNREMYFDTVLWCCLHNTCYDAQSEGERSPYLYNAIYLFDNESRFEDAIIERFNARGLEYWLFFQLAGLLRVLAEEGHDKAGDALKARHDALYASIIRRRTIKKTEMELYELLCIDLVELLGFSFFKDTVERVDLFGLKNEEIAGAFDMPWFLSVAEQQFGKKRVMQYLEKRTVKSAAAAAFIEEMAEDQSGTVSRRQQPTMEEYLMPEDADPKTTVAIKRIMSYRLLKLVTPEDLMVIAERAVNEEDLDFRAALLQIFARTPFTLDERYIFEFAGSSHELLRQIAFEMMEQIKSDAVRAFTVDKLQRDEDIPDMISVLCSQYRPQDEKFICEKLKSVSVKYNSGSWHGAFIAVEGAIEKCRHRPQTDILLYMYRNTLCSYCRESIVKLMHKKRVLPREVLEECAWDCNMDTRRWAERMLKSAK